MAKKKNDAAGLVGSWAFIIGVVIAVVIGLFWGLPSAIEGTAVAVLIILGLVVGFVNITRKETTNFLLVSTVLLLFSKLGAEVLVKVPTIGMYLTKILNIIVIFIVPAVIIVALKAIYALEVKE